MIEGLGGKLRGQYVPAPMYDEAMKYRDEYRRQAGTKRK
jgi:hypothetical protein